MIRVFSHSITRPPSALENVSFSTMPFVEPTAAELTAMAGLSER